MSGRRRKVAAPVALLVFLWGCAPEEERQCTFWFGVSLPDAAATTARSVARTLRAKTPRPAEAASFRRRTSPREPLEAR